MKTIVSLVLGGILFASSFRAEAAEITFETFYDALTPYGDWLYVEGYGDCWQPRVAEDWRPYTLGSWVDSDGGWLWVSEEDFGWAVYHYGRWAQVRGYGWVWVPGYEWAPAWVSWRDNSEYIGWAPLPPEAVWTADVGFGGWVDYRYDIGPSWYSFCPIVSFCSPGVYRHCVPWRNNVTIINNTVNVTNINYVNNGNIFIGGPNVNIVRNATGNSFRRLNIDRMADINVDELRANRLRNRVDGDTFRAIAPRVARNENLRPKQVAAKVERAAVSRGWDVDDDKVAAIRARNREMARKSQAETGTAPLPLSVNEERRTRAADPNVLRAPSDSNAGRSNAERLARESRENQENQKRFLRDEQVVPPGTEGTPSQADDNNKRFAREQADFQARLAEQRERQRSQVGEDQARQQAETARRARLEQAAQENRRAGAQQGSEASRVPDFQAQAQRQRENAAREQAADAQRESLRSRLQEQSQRQQQSDQLRSRQSDQQRQQQQQYQQQRQQEQQQEQRRQAQQQQQQRQVEQRRPQQQPQRQQQQQQQQQPQRQQQSSDGGKKSKQSSDEGSGNALERWKNRNN